MNTEKLGDKTRSEIVRQIQKMLDIYAGELNTAYIKHKDAPFTISFKSKILGAGDINHVTTDITFRPEPDTKDEETGAVDEAQFPLFQEVA